MTKDKTMDHLHHARSAPLSVRPCDTPNVADKKVSLTAEELHKVTGCRKFKDYRKLVSSTGGKYVDIGEFPEALGTYATISKSRLGKITHRTRFRYLDKVHMDIGFGNTMAVSGAHYALKLADRATHYNWVFALKSLTKEKIRPPLTFLC